VIVALLLFVGSLVLVFWPLRTIVQSGKVRGSWKLAWVGLWLVAFLLGGLISSLFMFAARRSDSSILLALMPFAGVVPIWAVFFLFRARTRDRPEVQSNAQSLAFTFGKKIGRLFGSK